MNRYTAISGCVLMCAAGSAWGQQVHVEDFEDGRNPAQWSFFSQTGAPGEFIAQSGGNPGRYLHADVFNWPVLRTLTGSEFTGDYAGREVRGVGVDLITFSVQLGGPQPLTVALWSDNGTPGDPTDDWLVYFQGTELVPEPGAGWKSFRFDIPSQATSTPPGWTFVTLGLNSPGQPDWEMLMSDVMRLSFHHLPPDQPGIFPMWEVGADNIFIEWGDQCYPDCNGDGVLDFFDFLCFQNAFLAQDPYADCDQNGVFDFFDFLCFQNEFLAGCP